MNTTVVAALAVAATAVLGCIGAILALAFRIGRLVGTVQNNDTNSQADRQRIWQEIGATNARIERHLEIFHGGNSRVR